MFLLSNCAWVSISERIVRGKRFTDQGPTMKRLSLAIALLAVAGKTMAADTLTIPMNLIDTNGVGASVGQVRVTETKYGVVFLPNLKGLTPGLHGFHVHENPSCATKEKDGKKVPGLAAGGHLDPLKTGKHDSPWGDGHLGDLPPLYVDQQGNAVQPVLAPRLKLSDLAARSIMVHFGGDNHADHPMPMGGGGMRMVCGVHP